MPVYAKTVGQVVTATWKWFRARTQLFERTLSLMISAKMVAYVKIT